MDPSLRAPTSHASIDERCARVPVVLVPMRVPAAGGEAPMVDRLALVGEPVTEVIGRPLLATSDVDTAGVSLVHFGVIAPKSPTGLGPVDLLIMVGTAAVSAFFVFFIAMLMLESTRSGPLVPALVAIVSMPLVAFAVHRFSRRPARDGWTCVVGDRGFQVGTVRNGALDRTVVVFDDPSDVWIESSVLGVTKHASLVMGVTRTLEIRSRDDLSVVVSCAGSVDPKRLRAPLAELGTSRIDAERYIALGEVWERARAIRLAQARAEISRGQPLTLPTLDGRRVTIVPQGVDETGRPRVGLEIARGGKTVLSGGPGEVRVRLQKGVYEVQSASARDTIDRAELGDPYLLDAFFLGDWGQAIPADGCLTRAALMPAG